MPKQRHYFVPSLAAASAYVLLGLGACRPSAGHDSALDQVDDAASLDGETDALWRNLPTDPAVLTKTTANIATTPLRTWATNASAQAGAAASIVVGGYQVKNLRGQLTNADTAMKSFTARYGSLQDFSAKTGVALKIPGRGELRTALANIGAYYSGHALSTNSSALTGSVDGCATRVLGVLQLRQDCATATMATLLRYATSTEEQKQLEASTSDQNAAFKSCLAKADDMARNQSSSDCKVADISSGSAGATIGTPGASPMNAPGISPGINNGQRRGGL